MKNIKFYLIIVALALSLIFLIFKYLACRKEAESYRLAKNQEKEEILKQAKEIKRAVNEHGIETVLLDITSNHLPAEKAENKGRQKDLVDTAAMALDIRNKQLKEITVINASLKAENLQLKTMIDANKKPYYSYNQNGLTLKLTPPADSSGYATADFSGNVGITIAQGYKRKWLLGKEKTMMTVTSNSPYFKISDIKYIGFDRRPTNFNLEAQAASSFNRMTGVGVGPGLKVELGRLDLQGNYQYYQQQKNWMFGANATFRLGKL